MLDPFVVAPLLASPTGDRAVCRLISTEPIGDLATIGPLPEWYFDEGVKALTRAHGETHSFELRDACFSLECFPEEEGRGPGGLVSSPVRRRLRLATLALWLATDNPVASDCWVTRYSSGVVLPGPMDPSPAFTMKSLLTSDDVRRGAQLGPGLMAAPRPSPIYSALLWSWRALEAFEWELRLPSLWIGIEALVARGDPKVRASVKKAKTLLVYESIALNVGHVLHAAAPSEPDLKEMWDWRNGAIHGSKLEGVRDRPAAIQRFEGLLRALLRTILCDRTTWLHFHSEAARLRYLPA